MRSFVVHWTLLFPPLRVVHCRTRWEFLELHAIDRISMKSIWMPFFPNENLVIREARCVTGHRCAFVREESWSVNLDRNDWFDDDERFVHNIQRTWIGGRRRGSETQWMRQPFSNVDRWSWTMEERLVCRIDVICHWEEGDGWIVVSFWICFPFLILSINDTHAETIPKAKTSVGWHSIANRWSSVENVF